MKSLVLPEINEFYALPRDEKVFLTPEEIETLSGDFRKGDSENTVFLPKGTKVFLLGYTTDTKGVKASVYIGCQNIKTEIYIPEAPSRW